MYTHVSRLLSLFVFLGLAILDWFIAYFNPEANVGNWLAAAFGAFVIRFANPRLPFGASIMGWLVAFIFSCLFAPDIMLNGGIWFIHRSEGVFGAVAFIGDLTIQFIAWLIRMGSGMGKYAEANPGQAFDETLDRVEKVTNVWLRIKAPLLDLFSSVSTLFKKS